jgi:hypothetical protein
VVDAPHDSCVLPYVVREVHRVRGCVPGRGPDIFSPSGYSTVEDCGGYAWAVIREKV